MAANLLSATAPSGTRVSPLKGVTGTTVGTPVLTATGYVVTVAYDAEFAHLSPAGGADFAIEEVKVVEDAPAAPAARTLRPAQGESVVGGAWELLYNKPRAGVQIVRDRGVYALVCVKHLTVHRLERLSGEGAVRKAGGWCASCGH